MDKAREITLKTLYKIEEEKAYSNIALDELLKQNRHKLNEKDIGFISEMVYGITTWKLTIDEMIKKYSKIRLKKISPWILNILRMGIYQIVFLDKVPKSAAVNESVNLAKRYGHSSSSNFVNAILRKIEKTDLEEFQKIKNPIERISMQTSMPIWLVEELKKDKTIKEVEQICRALNEKPFLTIRINRTKISKKEIEEALTNRNIVFKETELEDFLILEKIKNIENIDLFKEGYFTVQDLSAGLTAVVLDPKEGDKVLDACAAPGGKTTYLAELMKDKGEVEAWDIHEHRISLIQQNTKRLNLTSIKTKIQDSTIEKTEDKEKFDKILLDVPCLGIGVIKRKPDIKWQRKKEDIKEIIKIQEKILQNCAQYLKRGGFLVYSTCSILKQENEYIIQEFLKNNKEYTLKKIDDNIIKKLQIDQKKEGILEINPNKERDGFFIAKLEKK